MAVEARALAALTEAFPGTTVVDAPPAPPRRRRPQPYKRGTAPAPSTSAPGRSTSATPPSIPRGADSNVVFRSLAGLKPDLWSVRRHWPVRTRRTWALDWAAGVGQAGRQPVPVVPRSSLAGLLAAWPPGFRRLFLVGPPPATTVGELREWATGELPDGWGRDPKKSHHLANARSFVLHLTGPDGQPVSVVRAAAWFGEGAYTARDALDAFAWLYGALRASWGPEAGIFDTPATTGRDLWARLVPAGDGWPVLPAEVRELIAAHAGQGRIEGWWERGQLMPAQLDGLEVWDGTLMYAALCDNVGVGPVVAHDQGDGWPGPEHGGAYAPGWYRVTFTVPDRWAPTAPAGIVGGPRQQLGLLPVKTGDGWRYPNSGTHTTWVNGAELLFAWMAYGAGAFTIHERLILSRAPAKGPLHVWASRLIDLRERAAGIGDETVRALARRAVRALAITSIGAFAMRARLRTVEADNTVPGLTDWSVTANGYVWTEEEPSAWASMAHPEWAATVWSRCRARMLSHKGVGALHLSPADLIAVYVDALYIAGGRGTETWPDDNMPGRLRRKAVVAGPLPAPTSWAQLWEVA